MSESVKIGGIRKNPAIDKISRLDSMDVKNMAKNKMEKLLQTEEFTRSGIFTRQVPVTFEKIKEEMNCR
ncbi:MAG: hypothetical protein K2O97_07545 [Acetatifactor sp.]|nr:hypothetical protein [Acetatifactor sp.]MDE7044857.1 hypothetical protein [Acetatifactor sp.]